MGAMGLPTRGVLYLDAQLIIYTVERHPTYATALRPIWDAAKKRDLNVVTGELSLLEVMILPIRNGNAELEADYEHAMTRTELRLLPITQAVLRAAARLRAGLPSLRTPGRDPCSDRKACRMHQFRKQ